MITVDVMADAQHRPTPPSEHGSDAGTDTGSDAGAWPDRGPGLNTTELAMLRLEHGWFKYAGAKEARIRDEFGISTTRYYQVLNALIDKPAALAADPLTVGRLRRLREQRKAGRSAPR